MVKSRLCSENGFRDKELVTLYYSLEEAKANAPSCEAEDAIDEWLREVNLELVVRGVFAW